MDRKMATFYNHHDGHRTSPFTSVTLEREGGANNLVEKRHHDGCNGSCESLNWPDREQYSEPGDVEEGLAQDYNRGHGAPGQAVGVDKTNGQVKNDGEHAGWEEYKGESDDLVDGQSVRSCKLLLNRGSTTTKDKKIF